MSKQQELKSRHNIIWGGLWTLIVVTVMVFASEYLGEPEIIFPEVAALAVGMSLSPELTWQTDYLRMVISITICAVLGVCIVVWIPVSLWLQLAIAYVISQLIYLYSGTTFTPMISAIVLPVFLQTRGLVYPLSVLFLCVLLVLVRTGLVWSGVRRGTGYQPVKFPGKIALQNTVFRCIAVIVLIYIALAFGVGFCIAPPLLVIFTELVRRDHPARERMISVVELVTISSLSGTFARYYLGITLGLPLYLAVIPAVVIMILCMYWMKLYFPPAGAVLMLAFLIPQMQVMFYPLQILVGIFVLLLVAWRLPQKQE